MKRIEREIQLITVKGKVLCFWYTTSNSLFKSRTFFVCKYIQCYQIISLSFIFIIKDIFLRVAFDDYIIQQITATK